MKTNSIILGYGNNSFQKGLPHATHDKFLGFAAKSKWFQRDLMVWLNGFKGVWVDSWRIVMIVKSNLQMLN